MELDPIASSPSPASSAGADLLAGTPYRTIGLLGKGGMGEVLLARHTALDRTVVVKILAPTFASSADFADRLRLEAQLVARLSHPNIVMVLDFGKTTTGRPYLVMERLVGHTLKDEVGRRGPLPWREVAKMGVELLRGLAVAHQAGIVHRDIKPENVFLAEGPNNGARVLKLLDFGIAKMAADRPGPMPLLVPTSQGMLLGTPRFVAPEQACAAQVDARTDLYSVGVLLHWLLTMVGPFPHVQGMVALLRAHVLEAPTRPSALGLPDIPRALDDIILKALEKRPENRFQSAESFEEALCQCLAEETKPARWLVTERLPIAPRPKPEPLPDATTLVRALPAPSDNAKSAEARPWLAPALAGAAFFVALAASTLVAFWLSG